ncbi:MAG: AmmeMemoRadiSam system radical SAM enzyme, partial [Candidatus Hydrothermarchaeales archaeon]
MEKEAMLWEAVEKNKVHCKLCSRGCIVKEGKRGFCRVRENRKGKLYTLNYALASSIASDPIEKKPLFHFHPGTNVFSLGTLSCNFRCLHCQNYTISQVDLDKGYLQEVKPKKAVEMARKWGCEGIAWTYNEPTIWFEYSFDTAKLAKDAGLYTVYVTNGYMTEEALDTISPYLDAMNVDVKGFTEKFYKEVCKAKLKPVLRTVENAAAMGMHLEITNLLIPGYNDDEEEIKNLVDWVAGVDDSIPLHFSRFHPDYELRNIHATPSKTLEKAMKIASKKLKYVYIGNVPGHKGENTYCHNCGELLI